MTFRFFIHSLHGSVLKDLEWCETHPLGGGETGVLCMARSLKKLGHLVDVVTDLNELRSRPCDVFIGLQRWEVFRDSPGPGQLNYFWAMDDVDVPSTRDLADHRIAEKVLQHCDAVILCSNYHQQRWCEAFKIPPGKIFLSSMGIPLERFGAPRFNLEKRPRRAYYSSTPNRGLSVLLQTLPLIKAAVPDAELVVYSSLQVYGCQELPEFQVMYDVARKLPRVIYKGSVGQAELRQAAMACRVLAYPCIFPETSCITAMEAMAAGCVVVGTSLGALPETAWRNPLIVPQTNGWLNEWAAEVARLLVDDAYYRMIAEQNLALSSMLSWDEVAKRWLLRIRSDLAKRGEMIHGAVARGRVRCETQWTHEPENTPGRLT